MPLAVWRIHRRIGMGGGLFVSALARETGRTLSPEDVAGIAVMLAARAGNFITGQTMVVDGGGLIAGGEFPT